MLDSQNGSQAHIGPSLHDVRFTPKADILQHDRDVRFVPEADDSNNCSIIEPGPIRKNGLVPMRPLTAYWIGVVIVLAVLNGIRALPAGSRARRSLWNMGIAAAVLGSLAILAFKSGSQNANSPSAPDAQ